MKNIWIFPVLFCVCLGLSTGRAEAYKYALMHITPGQGYQETEARLVEKSLNSPGGANGSIPIQGVYTAEPRQLLKAFQQYKPDLTLSGLADYIRGLMPGPAAPGTWDTSYIGGNPPSKDTQIYVGGYGMTLTAQTVVLYQGSDMVQVEGNVDGTKSCGNVLRKLTVIARTLTKKPPTPLPTEAPATPPPVIAQVTDCSVLVAVREHVQPQQVIVDIRWENGQSESFGPFNTYSESKHSHDVLERDGVRYIVQGLPLRNGQKFLETPNCGVPPTYVHACWGTTGIGYHLDPAQIVEAKEESRFVFRGRVILNRKDPILFPAPSGAVISGYGGQRLSQGPRYSNQQPYPAYPGGYPQQRAIVPQGAPPVYYGQGYPQQRQAPHASAAQFILNILAPLLLNRRGPICQFDRFGHRICH